MTETRRRRWIVAGGGTGGHVTPALALAERIAERGDALVLMGSEHGLETRWVPETGFDLVALPARQMVGRGLLSRARAVPDMLTACALARRTLRSFRTDFVISVGGYASVPAVVAAVLARVPLALVEPNAIPGRANRVAARFACRIFLQFEQTAAGFGTSVGNDRIRVSGIPLRSSLVKAFDRASSRGAPVRPIHLMVFGGSQGAHQINEVLIAAAPSLDASALEIFHQTGAADRDRVAHAYAAAGITAEVVAFEPEMPRRYRWADVAICRAGAITVAELAIAALPALLVPYPHAADDHQTANARALTDAGAARVLDSRTLSGERIVETLASLTAAPETLREMSDRAAKRARPDAAERIVAECAALMEAREAS